MVLACELLGMDVALVESLDGDHAVRADGTPAPEVRGLGELLRRSWCGRVRERGLLLVPEVQLEADLAAEPVTGALGLQAFAGVLLHDAAGHPVGTLCVLGHLPHASLNTRDGDVLQALGVVVAEQLQALRSPLVPRQRHEPALGEVAETLARAEDLEQLSRPLLEALHDLTGLGSTYLTAVRDGVQELRFTRNARPDFAMPEGLLVPWEDTLCKRALDEGRPCTTDVPRVWGDSDAARALGIQTYVSVPVTLSDGQLWGTLCGADSTVATDLEEHLPTMRLFARLIAAEVERTAAVARERATAARARAEADTDALTHCAARRVVEPWLTSHLDGLGGDEAVVVVYADVDRFKQVNDEHGHAAGDAVLVEVGRRLRAAARPGDLVARLGGDEFVVAARTSRQHAAALAGRVADQLSFALAWGEEPLEVRCSVGFAHSDGHDAQALLAAADADMYAVKRR
jgi:diguanylate cyclase